MRRAISESGLVSGIKDDNIVEADALKVTAELVSLAVTGLAVWIPLFFLKSFGSSFEDDPKNDGETTASGSKTTRSWNSQRIFGRSRKSEMGLV